MPDEIRVLRPDMARTLTAEDVADGAALAGGINKALLDGVTVLRRAYLTEQLAALAAYGNADDERAAAIRAELDDVDQADAPAPARPRKARP